MAFDYSKSKSYQKIVSKAKSYSSKGRTSLKAQKTRMGERRSILTPILKDIGAKQIRELVQNDPANSKAVKWMKENREKANQLRIAAEKSGLDDGAFSEYEAMMAALKRTDPEDMEKAYRKEKKIQDRITRKRKANNYGRDLYEKIKWR